MPVTLITAPAGAGKTEYLLNLPHPTAGITHVCVPTALQATAWRQRLARRRSTPQAPTGALGVRVLTFDGLVDHCLHEATVPFAEVREPVYFRILRDVLATVPLSHYETIRQKPGFAQILLAFIAEMKAGRIDPRQFQAAVRQTRGGDRLLELGAIYAAYQERLQIKQWADRAGRTWLAVEQLPHAPAVGRSWPRLIVDGFDNFTTVQLAFFELLAKRAGECIFALTLPSNNPERFPRFVRTCRQIEATFDVTAQPLRGPDAPSTAVPLRRLGRALFLPVTEQIETEREIELLAVATQAAEARAALRWLKKQLVGRNLHLADVAVVARELGPYRPHLRQASREMGLPLRLVDGLPLRRNPAVAALLNLLRLFLPDGDAGAEPALPRRRLLDTWRSPYFDWETCIPPDTDRAVALESGDADRLDALSRRRQIVGGLSQWRQGLTWLVDAAGSATMEESVDEDRDAFPPDLPFGQEAADLRDRFERFVAALRPETGEHALRHHIAWLDDIIGTAERNTAAPFSPGILRQVLRDADAELAGRDLAALKAFKEVLRSLLWVEHSVDSSRRHTFAEFVAELLGAVDAAVYLPPHLQQTDAILAANVIQARGLSFRALAFLGLGEGLFPAVLREDPILRDEDRHRMQEAGLEVELSTASDERAFFYETINRPTEALLVTRPRLAENGATWVPSPFWHEILRLINVTPQEVGDARPLPAEACSPVELLESAVAYDAAEARAWLQEEAPELIAHSDHASAVLRARNRPEPTTYDGDLGHMEALLDRRLGPENPWSASRLESYLTCGYFFFIARLLGVKQREEPGEEVGARQSGTIYHRIFEELYAAPRLPDAETEEEVRALVTEIAGPLLDAAPEKEGFRPTAWWEQTRREMVENVVLSVLALRELDDGFEPIEREAYFKNLVLRDGDAHFRLRGLVDRVDRDGEGNLRIIDYKLGGPYAYGKRALEQGKKLQLPLYALAVSDDLQLGRVVDGFYWHVRHQEPSSLTLAKYGLAAALDVAREYAWQAVRGARAGRFRPTPPADGCPPYCPAAAFCWHYNPGFSR